MKLLEGSAHLALILCRRDKQICPIPECLRIWKSPGRIRWRCAAAVERMTRRRRPPAGSEAGAGEPAAARLQGCAGGRVDAAVSVGGPRRRQSGTARQRR